MSGRITIEYAIVLCVAITVLLPDCVLADSQNVSSTSANISKITEQEKTLSANQFIVLADTHIIQAIRHMLENNNTGALDQLALAQQQLDNVLMR